MYGRGLVAEVLPTPTFALPRKDFQVWAADRTRFRMEDFHREQRRRFGILMDGDKPVGNRWNYDEDDREPPPKKQASLDVPPPYKPREDHIDEGVRRDLDAMNLDTVGVISTGTSGRIMLTSTNFRRPSGCPTGGRSSTPTQSPPSAFAVRSKGSAIGAGPVTSNA
jgi:hypothetical protein